MTRSQTQIWAFARSVLGSDAAADAWMKAPNRSLDNEREIDLLQSEGGAREVQDALGRIQHGIFS
jgi:putative toxin-antitoxin system antitoxin component (TIGR02293 family)